ncbi:hypothetical protein [Streptomyces lydicus]|uniref:hypothetical protein n=1 Tax=Streptomyces lydicus TaxID=47763 RepID=UPI0037B35AF4
MAARKTTTRKTSPKPKPCADCKNAGQTSEIFQVGGRTKHDSADKQEALCLTCWGTGEAPAT